MIPQPKEFRKPILDRRLGRSLALPRGRALRALTMGTPPFGRLGRSLALPSGRALRALTMGTPPFGRLGRSLALPRDRALRADTMGMPHAGKLRSGRPRFQASVLIS